MDINEKNMDILERMDAEFSAEEAMTEGERHPAGDSSESPEITAEMEKIEKAEETRREYMARKSAERIAREQQIEMDQILLMKESSLRSAATSGAIQSGTVAWTEPIVSKDGEKEIAFVIWPEEDLNIKIIIPFSEAFTRNPIDLNRSGIRGNGGPINLSTPDGKNEYLRRMRAFARKMIDAPFNYVIQKVIPDGDTIICVASRAAAMRKIAKRAFGGAHPLCKVGDVGKATITSVSVHALAVEYNGIDVVIPQYRLSLQYMNRVYDKFRIGDKLSVKVRDIERDPSGNVIGLQLDHIACELDDARSRYRMIAPKSSLKGIITNVYRVPGTTKINIYAWLQSIKVPAKVLNMDANTFGTNIASGEQVTLSVVGYDERGYLICFASSVHGNDAMFKF